MPISKIPGAGLDTGSSGVAPGNLTTGGPYWDGSGNVGIGTTSPGYAVDVRRGAGVDSYMLLAGNNGGTTSGMLIGQDTAGLSRIFQFGANPITFWTNSSERARIDSSGNFYIGATGQVVNTYLLTLNYSGNAQKGGIMFNDSDSGQTYEACYFRKDGAQRGYIRVATTGTTYATVSDYRLKENVQPMTGALAKVVALKPCTYTWKDSDISGQGFVAHELQAIVPECVTGEKDAVETYVDDDGNEQTRPKYQGIDTSFLVATLTAAIQEQQQMIETLQAKVAALEAK